MEFGSNFYHSTLELWFEIIYSQACGLNKGHWELYELTSNLAALVHFFQKLMSLQFVILVYECIINFTKCELLSGKSVYVPETCLTRPCFAPIAPYRNTICRCTFHRCAFYHGSSGKVIIACNLIVDFIYLSRGIMSAILDPVLPGNRRICLHRWFRLTNLFWDVFVPGFRGREHFQGLISL